MDDQSVLEDADPGGTAQSGEEDERLGDDEGDDGGDLEVDRAVAHGVDDCTHALNLQLDVGDDEDRREDSHEDRQPTRAEPVFDDVGETDELVPGGIGPEQRADEVGDDETDAQVPDEVEDRHTVGVGPTGRAEERKARIRFACHEQQDEDEAEPPPGHRPFVQRLLPAAAGPDADADGREHCEAEDDAGDDRGGAHFAASSISWSSPNATSEGMCSGRSCR